MNNKVRKNYRLPKKFAEKWLKALRSGDYKQGRGGLIESDWMSDDFKYCCLGVACRIEYTYNYLSRIGIWNSGVIDKDPFINLNVDLKRIPEEIKGDGRNTLVDTLTTMNDNGYTFKEIADWIEKRIEFY